MEPERQFGSNDTNEKKPLQAAHDRLQKENMELQRSNDELEDFAHTASHDLQAPLRGISQMAEILKEDYAHKLDAEGQEIIANIMQSARRMKLLLDDLLQYARISTEERKMPVNRILSEAIENLKNDINETKTVITHGGLPPNELSAMLIHVFQNLIANAINYRRDEVPRIHVSAEKVSKQWVFCVSDNGIGVDEKNYLRIFEPFQRLHGRDISGSGLGLHVCRKIIESLGGTINVSSHKDVGSKFCFTVPV